MIIMLLSVKGFTVQWPLPPRGISRPEFSGRPRNSTLGIQTSNIIKKRDKINEYHYLFGAFLKILVCQCQGSTPGCCTIYSNLWLDAHLLVTVAAAPFGRCPVLAGFGGSIFLI
jgi:hypothetical protein